jgi:Negative regulator of sigma E activity
MSSRSDHEKPSGINDEKVLDISAAVSESISALLDNQGNDLDVRRVLREAEDSDHVRAKWQRYHVASAILRNEPSAAMPVDLSEHLRAEIAVEPSHSSTSTGGKARKWLDAMAKSGIAAAVALGLLVGVQQYSERVDEQPHANLADVEPFVAPDLNSAVVPAGFDAPQLSARTVSTVQNAPVKIYPRRVLHAAYRLAPMEPCPWLQTLNYRHISVV